MMTDPGAAKSPRQWSHAVSGGRYTVDATTDEMLRIAFVPDGGPPHRTWSIAPSAAGLSATTTTLDDYGNEATLRSNAIQASLSVPAEDTILRVQVARADGSTLLAGASVTVTPAGRPVWESVLAEGERVFGGGERTGPLDKRGRRLTHWTTDPLPNHGDQTDGMYQSVPFFMGLVDGNAYGVYFDVNARAVADIGQSQPDMLSYAPESADFVVYIFAGPTLGDVLRQYTALTGRMPSLPRWAFGNQQSRWSYMSADEVLSIASEFRTRAIPCDAIYLDIDYMDGYRVFTWNSERFPDPAAMVQRLREQHLRLVTIIDPGVKVDPAFRVYEEGVASGYFTRGPDGSPFKGWVWPGQSCWADFARDDVRAWWGEQHQGLIAAGVAGIWNDMNEPAQAGMSAPPGVTIAHGETLPDDVLHGTSSDTITHAQFHNAYGLAMCQATYESLRALRPDEHPFVLTRAATAGSQRYALVWNGDSTSSWQNLRLAVSLNLGVGLSGFPVTGGDVGGFWGDTTAELLVRWTQLGALLPFCRNHSAMGTARQEPWAFGEPYTSHCRSAIERRYQLLPYVLTLAHEATVTGAPIVRPLAWIAPTHAASLACDDQFLLGDAVLAAPVLDDSATMREVLLPPGEWFAWESSQMLAGDQSITLPVTLDSMPLYVRAGAIVPLATVAQSTDGMTDQALTLHVYLSPARPSATADLWHDDDQPEAEQRGTFGRWQTRANWNGGEVTVALQRVEGQLPWPYPGCDIVLHLPQGWSSRPLDTDSDRRSDTFTARYHITED
ncbi:MAG TPA: glycoside hydrolase family 31 protein [Ktedonobacterales bacterium]|nr:glycoside hydrolase family 31 protein [Ktedonobacterales bacterium]